MSVDQRTLARCLALILPLLGIAATGSAFAKSVDLSAERPSLVIPRLERTPTIDEFLAMRVPDDLEGSLARVAGFVQNSPEDGENATQETEVYTGYDDENLYVVFLAFDDDPASIRAHMTRRENIFGDERVQIQLDTFNDQRRAFSFMTNPHGIQWDAIWTEGQGYDSSWDTLWHSEGRLTEQGYVVWMEIPFKSLRFAPSDDQTWRVLFLRDIPRNDETVFWPRVSSRIEGRLNQASTLHGLSGISPGRNIEVIPYGTAGNSRIVNEDGTIERETFEGDLGVDAKFVINNSLALDITANPDFSQVESDQPQVTVNQRFELFFPEKRPFFLENANFFRTPINLLFTRRIADPKVGTRLTGKVGNWSLGALLANDEAPGKVAAPGSVEAGENARFGVFRLSRDLPNQSWLGVIYTHRDFMESSNDVGGIDGRFKFGDNWSTEFQAVYSTTTTEDGESLSDPAYRLRVARDGRTVNANFNYRDFGKEFRTETGFVPRTDLREVTQWFRYRFWPEGDVLVNWGPQFWMRRSEDQSGLRLDSNVNPSLRFDFRNASGFAVWHWEERSRLRPEDFDTLTTPVDFDTSGNSINLWSDAFAWMGFRASTWAGNSINFVPPDGHPPSASDSAGADLNLTFRPLRNVVNDNLFIFSRLEDAQSGDRIFSNRIIRSQWNWQFNVQWSLRTILQYDETKANPELTRLETTKNFNADFLLTYLVNPGTAAFIGYNSNYQNLDLIRPPTGQRGESSLVRSDSGLFNDARGLFVKISYLFRL